MTTTQKAVRGPDGSPATGKSGSSGQLDRRALPNRVDNSLHRPLSSDGPKPKSSKRQGCGSSGAPHISTDCARDRGDQKPPRQAESIGVKTNPVPLHYKAKTEDRESNRCERQIAFVDGDCGPIPPGPKSPHARVANHDGCAKSGDTAIDDHSTGKFHPLDKSKLFQNQSHIYRKCVCGRLLSALRNKSDVILRSKICTHLNNNFWRPAQKHNADDDNVIRVRKRDGFCTVVRSVADSPFLRITDSVGDIVFETERALIPVLICAVQFDGFALRRESLALDAYRVSNDLKALRVMTKKIADADFVYCDEELISRLPIIRTVCDFDEVVYMDGPIKAQDQQRAGPAMSPVDVCEARPTAGLALPSVGKRADSEDRHVATLATATFATQTDANSCLDHPNSERNAVNEQNPVVSERPSDGVTSPSTTVEIARTSIPHSTENARQLFPAVPDAIMQQQSRLTTNNTHWRRVDFQSSCGLATQRVLCLRAGMRFHPSNSVIAKICKAAGLRGVAGVSIAPLRKFPWLRFSSRLLWHMRAPILATLSSFLLVTEFHRFVERVSENPGTMSLFFMPFAKFLIHKIVSPTGLTVPSEVSISPPSAPPMVRDNIDVQTFETVLQRRWGHTPADSPIVNRKVLLPCNANALDYNQTGDVSIMAEQIMRRLNWLSMPFSAVFTAVVAKGVFAYLKRTIPSLISSFARQHPHLVTIHYQNTRLSDIAACACRYVCLGNKIFTNQQCLTEHGIVLDEGVFGVGHVGLIFKCDETIALVQEVAENLNVGAEYDSFSSSSMVKAGLIEQANGSSGIQLSLPMAVSEVCGHFEAPGITIPSFFQCWSHALTTIPVEQRSFVYDFVATHASPNREKVNFDVITASLQRHCLEKKVAASEVLIRKVHHLYENISLLLEHREKVSDYEGRAILPPFVVFGRCEACAVTFQGRAHQCQYERGHRCGFPLVRAVENGERAMYCGICQQPNDQSARLLSDIVSGRIRVLPGGNRVFSFRHFGLPPVDAVKRATDEMDVLPNGRLRCKVKVRPALFIPPNMLSPYLCAIGAAVVPTVTARSKPSVVSTLTARMFVRQPPRNPGTIADLFRTVIELANDFPRFTAAMPFYEWVSSFPPGKRSMYLSAHKSFEERPILEARDLSRKVFIKFELLLKDSSNYAGRGISSVSARAQCKLGPSIRSIGNLMKKAWHNRARVTYMAGRDIAAIGSLYRDWVQDGYVHFADGDYSKFDASVNMELLDCERCFYNCIGFSRSKNGAAWRVLDAQREFDGIFKIGKRTVATFSAAGVRNSGDANTSVGNSIINAAVATLAVKRLHVDARIAVMGDDVLIGTRRPLTSCEVTVIVNTAKEVGLTLILENRQSIANVHFLGGHPLPAVVNGVNSFVHVPEMMRFVGKHAWSLEPQLNPAAWVRGVAEGWKPVAAAHPLIRLFVKREFELTSHVSKAVWEPVYKRSIREHYSYALDTTVEISEHPQALAFLQQRYQFEIHELHELELLLSTAPLCSLVDCAMLTRMVNLE